MRSWGQSWVLCTAGGSRNRCVPCSSAVQVEFYVLILGPRRDEGSHAHLRLCRSQSSIAFLRAPKSSSVLSVISGMRERCRRLRRRRPLQLNALSSPQRRAKVAVHSLLYVWKSYNVAGGEEAVLLYPGRLPAIRYYPAMAIAFLTPAQSVLLPVQWGMLILLSFIADTSISRLRIVCSLIAVGTPPGRY